MFILGLRSWWRQKRAARRKKTLVFAVDLQDNDATSRELLCSCARATRSYFHICVDACVLGKRNKVGAQSPYDDMRLSRRHWILVGHPKLTPPARAKMRCNVHVVASASFVARAHIVGHSLSPFLFLAFSFSLSLSLSLSLSFSPSFFLPPPFSKMTVIDHQTVSVIDHRTVSVINQHHQYHCATRPCSNFGAVMRLSRASRLYKIMRWVSHGYKHLENHHKAALRLSGQLWKT